jgi:hypothetical protein
MNSLERISVNSNHSSRHPREDDSASSKPAPAADAEATLLPRGVAQALADPIVRALMAADRIDPNGMAELMCRMAARLRSRSASAEGSLPW